MKINFRFSGSHLGCKIVEINYYEVNEREMIFNVLEKIGAEKRYKYLKISLFNDITIKHNGIVIKNNHTSFLANEISDGATIDVNIVLTTLQLYLKLSISDWIREFYISINEDLNAITKKVFKNIPEIFEIIDIKGYEYNEYFMDEDYDLIYMKNKDTIILNCDFTPGINYKRLIKIFKLPKENDKNELLLEINMNITDPIKKIYEELIKNNTNYQEMVVCSEDEEPYNKELMLLEYGDDIKDKVYLNTSPFHIIIQTLYTMIKRSLEVGKDTTIEQIKINCEEYEGLSFKILSLEYKIKGEETIELEDDKTLSDYGIVNGAIIGLRYNP